MRLRTVVAVERGQRGDRAAALGELENRAVARGAGSRRGCSVQVAAAVHDQAVERVCAVGAVEQSQRGDRAAAMGHLEDRAITVAAGGAAVCGSAVQIAAAVHDQAAIRVQAIREAERGQRGQAQRKPDLESFQTGPEAVPAVGRRCRQVAALGGPGLAVRRSPRKPGGKRHGEAPLFDAVRDGMTERAPPAQTERPGFADPVEPLFGGQGHRPLFLFSWSGRRRNAIPWRCRPASAIVPSLNAPFAAKPARKSREGSHFFLPSPPSNWADSARKADNS